MLCHCGVCRGGLSQVVQTSSGKRVKTQPLVADINFGMAASAATQTASDLSRYCKYRVGRRLVSLQALRHELVSLLPGGWRHIQLPRLVVRHVVSDAVDEQPSPTARWASRRTPPSP